MFFHFFSRSWSELTDIRLDRVRVNEVKLYLHLELIEFDFFCVLLRLLGSHLRFILDLQPYKLSRYMKNNT